MSVESTARVGGNVTGHVDSAGDLSVADGATVGGTVDEQLVEREQRRNHYETFGYYFSQIIRLAGAFLTGLVLLWLIPALREASLPNVVAVLRSTGIGLAAAVTLPVAALIVCVTIVGIPLGILTFVLGAIGLYFSKAVIAQVIGRAGGGDRTRGADRIGQALARAGVPDAHGAGPAGGDDPLAIRGEGDAQQRPGRRAQLDRARRTGERGKAQCAFVVVDRAAEIGHLQSHAADARLAAQSKPGRPYAVPRSGAHRSMLEALRMFDVSIGVPRFVPTRREHLKRDLTILGGDDVRREAGHSRGRLLGQAAAQRAIRRQTQYRVGQCRRVRRRSTGCR